MHICYGPECDRPVRAKGLCATHYQQQRLGKELTEIGSTILKISGTTCVSEGCTNLRGKHRSYCEKCVYQRIYGQRTQEQRQAKDLQSNHKMSLEDAQLIWKEQGAKCACCSLPGPDVYSPSRAWHVDHDHSCCPGKKSCGKCIRGIVCKECNMRYLTKWMQDKENWLAVGRYLEHIGGI